MNRTQSVNPEVALGDARREFERWRAARTGRRKTPDSLRRRAVDLLEHHCAFHVCRALGINATALKRWSADEGTGGTTVDTFAETTFFVALEVEPSPRVLDNASASTTILTIELADDIRVRCESVHRTAELLELLRARHATVHCA